MEEVRTHVLETDRGEILVEDGGRLDGLAVVVHPGSPGSRLLYGAGTQLAARCGLRVLSFDRPGYGSRPAQPGRTIADIAVETGMIADRLGVGRFAVWGFSGGRSVRARVRRADARTGGGGLRVRVSCTVRA